ncbi:MAG: hypothetical protein KGI71_06295 [Patescibacteria group bacterium]|nr:hypothetical protein [Patescibacteria group bacterium]
MPKRVIDGEAIWDSRKLLNVEPTRFRAEYVNLLPLCLANGSFECDARGIWRTVYSYNRPDIKLEDVIAMLDSFERAKLLFRWLHRDGRWWGYWVGMEKAGRLPSTSAIVRYHMKLGPLPPHDEFLRFLGLKEADIEIHFPKGCPTDRGAGDVVSTRLLKRGRPQVVSGQAETFSVDKRGRATWLVEDDQEIPVEPTDTILPGTPEEAAPNFSDVDVLEADTIIDEDSRPGVADPAPQQPEEKIKRIVDKPAFIAPSLEQVVSYVRECGVESSAADAMGKRFYEYWSDPDRDWNMKAGTRHARKMSNFKLAVRTWISNERYFKATNGRKNANESIRKRVEREVEARVEAGSSGSR